MKKLILFLIVVFFLSSNIVSAAMNPEYKECLQRGYDTTYDPEDIHTFYCVFPDESRCKIEEFNNGTCGVVFKTENYCVKEESPVWDKDKCCEGLIPTHLKYRGFFWGGLIGQSRCEPIPNFFDRYLKYSLFFWLGILAVIVLVIILIYKKSKSK